MFYFSDLEIDSFVCEDLPYFDLTTGFLPSRDSLVTLSFVSREDGVIACSEEASRVFAKVGVESVSMIRTSEHISAKSIALSVMGSADAVLSVWKVAQNILEYSSGVATSTFGLVTKAKEVSPNIEIVTTRKTMPGAKKLLIKSIMAGGAMPHRLGLSESVLFFEQHVELFGGWDKFGAELDKIKSKAREKKIILEVSDILGAKKAASIGIDIIQIDKAKPESAKNIVDEIRCINPLAIVSLAGGINISNVQEYASCGADVLVTSALYHAKPLDITTKIQRLPN